MAKDLQERNSKEYETIDSHGHSPLSSFSSLRGDEPEASLTARNRGPRSLEIEQIGLEGSRFQFPKDKFTIAAVGLLLFGLFLLAAGAGMFLFKGSASGDDIKILEASQSADSGELVVDISGAVKNPGVYKLGAESRINDAVFAAGGLTDEADSKRINLAARISAGQKMHIATVSDTVSSGTTDTVSSSQTGLVNINSATEGELDKLPGVGPVTAGKIINGRPYSSVEELLSKKVVNSSTFEKIKGLVTY